MTRFLCLLALIAFAACGGAPGDGTGSGNGNGNGGGDPNTVTMTQQLADAPVCIKAATGVESNCGSVVRYNTGDDFPAFEYNLWAEKCIVEDGRIKLLGAIPNATVTRTDMTVFRTTVEINVPGDEWISIQAAISYTDKQNGPMTINGGASCVFVPKPTQGTTQPVIPRIAW